MFNWSNCDRKSELSRILTEPLNPRDLHNYPLKPLLSLLLRKVGIMFQSNKNLFIEFSYN